MTTARLISLLLAQAPAPLPSSPLTQRLLLENPWPLAGALAAAGVIAAMVLRSRGRGRLGLVIAATSLAAAAGLVFLSRTRVTESERLRAATADLVAAAAGVDEPKLTALLTEDAQVWVGEHALADGRSAILSRVRAHLGGTWAIREYDILQSQAHIDGPRVGRTQVEVRVIPEAIPLPDTSWWTIHWRRNASGAWVADRIEPWAEDIAAGLR